MASVRWDICTCTGEPGVYCPRCTALLGRVTNVRQGAPERREPIKTTPEPSETPTLITGQRGAKQRHTNLDASAVDARLNLLTIVYRNLKTVSESNQREHWSAKAQRAKDQRYTVFYNLRSFGPQKPPPLPVAVTLVRIAPRELDDDNLRSALKACRDGVADYLATGYLTGDDRQDGLTWLYHQERRKPREYGVEITITPL
jgi:hypothetical protein